MVTHMPQDSHQHERDRLAEVQGLRGGGQDLVGVAHVGVDVGRDPLRSAGQQGAGVGQDQGIVVHVDDPGVGGDSLGDLVGVVGGRQAGADVQELANLGLTGQVADGAGEELPGGPCDVDDFGEDLAILVTGGPVHRVVVLAAQPVVPDPGRVRHRGVDLGWCRGLAGRGGAVCHGKHPRFAWCRGRADDSRSQ
jgi:hypothetical protein